MRLIVPAVAGASLVIGFAIAQSSGVRWLGALVLVVGGLWCALQLWRVCGARVSVAIGLVYLIAFVASHPLGGVIGRWPAVLLVALIVAVCTYAVMRPTGRRDSTTSPPTISTR